jgi:hypothetical protein
MRTGAIWAEAVAVRTAKQNSNIRVAVEDPEVILS